METSYSLLAERSISTRELSRDHPAGAAHPNKKVLFSMRGPHEPTGEITVTRWRAGAVPVMIPTQKRPRISWTRHPFLYEASSSDEASWHLNFANADLFCSYGGPFFAQDEIQVAEHPSLASLRSWMLAQPDGVLRPITREGLVATPILLQNVARVRQIDTTEIYGARFARASQETVAAAVRWLEPPAYSNIIAMEAPVGGRGCYTSSELSRVVQTAYCGFSAAKQASKTKIVTIHTGHWGAGAYGGDKIVMSALQLLSAHLAGVDHLCYHTLDGPDEFVEGRQLYEHIVKVGLWERLTGRAPARSVEGALRSIESMKFRWGTSDGN